MPLLFTGETDQLRQFVPVNVNYTTDNFLPTLQSTEQTVLGQFIGAGVLEQLRLSAESPDPDLSGSDQRVIESALFLARAAVAQIGFANFAIFAEVQIDDDGITVSGSASRKAAFEYQTNKVKRTLTDMGWESLDKLLSLLASYPLLFPEWKTAPYYQEHQKAIFKSPADFSRYYPIGDRWLTFWALRFSIRTVEESAGETGLARIDALPTGVSEAGKEKAGRSLRRALAYQSVLEAIPFLSITLNGINVQVNYGSQYGNADYYQPPSQEQLNFVTANLQKQLDIAWASFDADVSKLELPTLTPSVSSVATGPYSTGPITIL